MGPKYERLVLESRTWPYMYIGEALINIFIVAFDFYEMLCMFHDLKFSFWICFKYNFITPFAFA